MHLILESEYEKISYNYPFTYINTKQRKCRLATAVQYVTADNKCFDIPPVHVCVCLSVFTASLEKKDIPVGCFAKDIHEIMKYREVSREEYSLGNNNCHRGAKG